MRASISTFAILACAGFTFAQECAQKSNENPTAGILAVRLPGLTSVVPVGTPYNIVWDKTSGISTVSIELCIGPSTDCVDSLCVASAIDNTGVYAWTPPTDLVSTGVSTTSGFGLKIIAAGGDFQYSTQFGVSNLNAESSSSKTPEHTGTTTKTKVHITGTTTHTKSIYAISSLSSSCDTETKTKSKHSKESATTFPTLTSVLVIGHPKHSTGIFSNSANGTAPHKGKTTTKTHTGKGSMMNSTEILSATTHKAKHSSIAAVTSTAIATASATPLPTTTTPPTTASTTPAATATGGAQKMLAGSFLVGLGFMAALVL